uniref:Uncharacterized protein n=1 Tax=Spongospora subterranea TaxID=70186 RepID=A0A0H5R9F9_9EUKA|eukprot:CRZ10312.1 hypothetical protein [Spongospora subterranea]
MHSANFRPTVDRKLEAIQERLTMFQDKLKTCQSDSARQPVISEIGFLQTRKMVCQKHKGVLLKSANTSKEEGWPSLVLVNRGFTNEYRLAESRIVSSCNQVL